MSSTTSRRSITEPAATVISAVSVPRRFNAPRHEAGVCLSDRGQSTAYKSRRFAKLLCRLGIKHVRTRPYAPRTNGKAERFIQTLLCEWIYPSSDHRARELQPWMFHYSFQRPHSATEHRPPITRLGFDGNNVLSKYS